MNVTVTKLTDVKLLQRANSFTTGRDSTMSLATAYKHGHSPIRTQMFWVELTDIPLFVASQLVRSHVGVQCFQRSKRPDRGGDDFRETCASLSRDILSLRREDMEDYRIPGRINVQEDTAYEVRHLSDKYDRYAPTDLAFICNAEALINMAHKRLCTKASKETRQLLQAIKAQVEQCDPDLAQHMVPQCVFRAGLCSEPKSCGWICTDAGADALEQYVSLYHKIK